MQELPQQNEFIDSPINFAVQDHLRIHPTKKEPFSSFDEVDESERNIIFD